MLILGYSVIYIYIYIYILSFKAIVTNYLVKCFNNFSISIKERMIYVFMQI